MAATISLGAVYTYKYEDNNHNLESITTKYDYETVELCMLHVKNVISESSIISEFKASYYGQDVIVKVLLVEQLCQRLKDSLKKLFHLEVSLWSKLDHPNVTKFIGASSSLCYMISEYLPGGTLKSYLTRNSTTKLSLKIVIQLALDLARGLSYLHSKEIVHRDVKTENMLLDERGRLKIADFGVARLVSLIQGKMVGQTGTQGYMAPEVLEGKPYDIKSDVYNFGMCLWEIYCCEQPFLQSKFANLSSAIVDKDLRPHIPKCCPKSLAKVMKSCWSSNPNKRPEMNDVVFSLECINTTKGGGMTPTDQAHCSCFFH